MDGYLAICHNCRVPEAELFRALANDKRLQILDWLRDPEAHFPPQRDGDLVKDGVCSLFIAEKLDVTQPTCGEHLKILSRARDYYRARRSSSGCSTSGTRSASER